MGFSLVRNTFLALILSIITITSFGGILYSPTAEELDKAPKMPPKFDGNPQTCKKLDNNILHTHFDNKKLIDDNPPYDALIDQVDLNSDGICEIYVMYKIWCGTGGCPFKIYEFKNGKFFEMGEWFGWNMRYLKAQNGWLQLLEVSGSGSSYVETLYQNINGKYQGIRRDIYEADTQALGNNAKYIKTEYPLKK